MEQITRYFSDPQYYFQVNDQYVRNKLKVVLFPFLHRVSKLGPFLSPSSVIIISAVKLRLVWVLLQTRRDTGPEYLNQSEVGSHTSLQSMISTRRTCTFRLWRLAPTLFLLAFHWDLMESKFFL